MMAHLSSCFFGFDEFRFRSANFDGTLFILFYEIEQFRTNYSKHDVSKAVSIQIDLFWYQ